MSKYKAKETTLKEHQVIETSPGHCHDHRQHHPEVPDEQGEASHMQLEELSTLEEENITEGQNEDDGVIGDQLADALDLIQNMVSANLGYERVKKATRHFVKKILNAKKSETMINLLHGIGNKVAAKMKKGKLNPVQTTAKGRRENQNSGRGPSTKGRRVKDQPKSLKEGL